MTQRKDGPYPYKQSASDPNPLLTAIVRNPRPFIMMSVGALGMLALVLFNTLGGADDKRDSRPPVTEMPAVSQPSAPVPVAPLSPVEQTPTPVTETMEVAVAEETAATELAASQPATPEAVISEVTAPETVTPGTKIVTEPYIALILDDIGNNAELGRRAVTLPGAVTYAMLPHTPHAASLAEQAHSLGKEIILHAPMANQAHFPLGPGALTAELSHEEFVQTLEESIAAIPHLQGVNNHMGSALTEQEVQMTWTMQALRKHGLYFVDSLTTANSVAGRIAREQNIPTISRNVFLDNETTFENIDREFQRLLTLAEKNGSAVGIGHPYVETLEYLENALPALAERNIELVPVSLMIARRKAVTNSDVSPEVNREINQDSSHEPGQEVDQADVSTGAW